MAELTPLVEAWIRYAEDDWQDSLILASAGRNGRANQAAVAVVINPDAMDSLADGMASVDYIRKKGPWITLHRSAS